jgi:hypothetical protein
MRDVGPVVRIGNRGFHMPRADYSNLHLVAAVDTVISESVPRLDVEARIDAGLGEGETRASSDGAGGSATIGEDLDKERAPIQLG